MNSEKKTILFVGDDFITSLTAKSELEKIGYHVVVARSGEHAVGIIRIYLKIDLVLIDIGFDDGVQGITAAEIISIERPIPIVFYSDNPEPLNITEFIAESRKKNSCGFIHKDLNCNELDASIQKTLKLFESDKTFRNLACTWYLDLKTGYFTASEECLRQFGFPPGSSPSFSQVSDCFLPEDRIRASDVLQKALNSGESYSIEVGICKANTGERLRIISTGTVMYDKNNNPSAVRGKNRDASETDSI